ncbi:relaxase/mobilization nuclease domain-containing protein [Phenylobacterium sp.]|jgi:hypothetical protein|uniref:relaxase/mobilization nuclease domain-containing protein n=1 Tax=Phenylobacterium sp. TaxID=1871053 RepID=UPI000C94C28D|nr:hypothetical protein [Phenylobacterium sp.]|tara:strand:- start:84338 stop:85369 length:1032 start_codon:yes stop_codon:yes gene_type:complete
MGAPDFRRPRGFEEHRVDQPPNRRTPAEILSAQPPLQPDQRAALWRLVGKAPQAVLVVPRSLSTSLQLGGYLNYISRGGSLTLHDENGLPLKGRGQIEELVEDWRCVDQLDSRRRINSPIARRFVFGAPPGTSPEAVEAAARLHLRRLHGRDHPFVQVTHTDTDHPHVHAVVRVLGRQRRRLTLHHRDLAIYREDYAKALREAGVEADATPRWLRGQPGRGETAGHWRSRADFEEKGGPAPRWLEAQYLEAAQLLRSSQPAGDRELRVIESRGRLHRGLLDLAWRLSRSPEEEDRRLSQALTTHVCRLPPPETERLTLSRQMQLRAMDRTRLEPSGERGERHR